MSLEHEQAVFQRELPRLLAEGEQGRFALIHGAEVDSTWDSRRDALQAGHQRFGLEPFFIRQISAVEKVHIITRLLVPHASPDIAPDQRRTCS